MRHGVILDDPHVQRPFRPLRVEPLVLALLRGQTGASSDLRVVAATRTLEELLIPVALKRRLVAELAPPARSGPGRIVVRGRHGSGRHTLLACLAAGANRQLAVIDVAPAMRDPEARVDRIRAALRRAHLLGMLPCLDGLELLASEDLPGRTLVRELLRQHEGPLAVRLPWDASPPLDPGYLLVDLPALAVSERLTAWKAAIAEHGLDARDPADLAGRYSVGPGVMFHVCAEVAHRSAEDEPASDGALVWGDVRGRLHAAVRQHLEHRLGTIATRIGRLPSWPQVILPQDILDSLVELIARIRHRGAVFDRWGFDRVITTARGVTALFQGGPGTGKTLVAGAIAKELGMDLYRVDLSRIMSKWIGETEQNLARLFDAAEDGQAIVLFDEADSLFARRTEVRTSVDRYANLEVNYLLQRLDSFEGIAILTTNFGGAIDVAFKRRLSFRLTFPFPDDEMRELLWKAHLPPELPRLGAIDFSDLGRRYRLSGGYIRNAALRAAFLSMGEGSAITQEHLERAIKAEFREIGKLSDSGVLE